MDVRRFCKATILSGSAFALVFLAGCTLNPVTGQKEFTGLMSAQDEQSIGASQHGEIIKEFGGEYQNSAIQNYVSEVGKKVAVHSERKDVQYKFTVLDSPIVNAFALPGGYIYITRGTLALANSEAELAAVLGHEVGHIAARHQAARYSHGMVAGIGAGLLGAVLGSPEISDVLSVGTELYMSSYSREHETQADQLGVRYLSAAGYDKMAMSHFLRDMNLYESYEKVSSGKDDGGFSYFSSHPDTAGRIKVAAGEAQKYPVANAFVVGDTQHLQRIRGMVFGDNSSQGFERDGVFYHPDLNFAFNVPQSLILTNLPDRIQISGKRDETVKISIYSSNDNTSMEDYLRGLLAKENQMPKIESIDINGMPAATLTTPVNLNNKEYDFRLIAVRLSSNEVVRMSILIPKGLGGEGVDALKRLTYSFRKMDAYEKANIKPYQLALVVARQGDTVQTLASNMAVSKHKVELFTSLNGMTPAMPVEAGKIYKIVR